jgi:hypothetical protein
VPEKSVVKSVVKSLVTGGWPGNARDSWTTKCILLKERARIGELLEGKPDDYEAKYTRHLNPRIAHKRRLGVTFAS